MHALPLDNPLAHCIYTMHIRLYCFPDAFEWDPAKAEANLQKHHIAFEDAVHVFDGPTVETFSPRNGELRTRRDRRGRGTGDHGGLRSPGQGVPDHLDAEGQER